MKKILFILTLLISRTISANDSFALSGNIKDKKTGEPLIGALITIQEQSGIGASADVEGNFALKLKGGKYTVKVFMIGYKASVKEIHLTANAQLNFELVEETASLEEVVVVADKNESHLAPVGMEKLEMAQVNKIPVLMGEKDVLKTIQLLPGVKGAGEGNSGFYVRGGTNDQNLVLLDDAPVYNATHLFGMFSTFNSDVIKDVTLYKAGMPASYGGRLSSVLDISMTDGDKEKFHTSGSLGLISSKLAVEGPILKNKGSFILSGRRTYADMFLKLSKDKELNSKTLYFYDLNGKATCTLNDKNRIYLTRYFGRDKLGFNENIGMDWGNSTASIRWNHIYHSKLLSNTTLIYSNYDYKVGVKLNDAKFALTSKINTKTLKHEYKYILGKDNKLVFGFASSYHQFTPGQVSSTDQDVVQPLKLQEKYALENGIYIDHNWKILNKLNLTYGLRISTFSPKGSGEFTILNREGVVIDTKKLKKNEFANANLNFEPRVSASYGLNERNSLKFSYTRNVQNIHLLSGSTSENPTDIWLPTSYNIKPEIADQFAAGYLNTFAKGGYEFSVETYYKGLQNQIDYKNGASVLANEKVEAELLYGIGRAYGLELFLKKKAGRFNGWIAYTLSRTERKIDGINEGKWYAAKQDRTHDISVVGIFDLNKKWSFSATWVYNTGNAVTFPTGKYKVDDQVQFVYSGRNEERMPAYHRMDIGATWTNKKTEKFESSWNFSIYNLYARENAYSITFKQDPANASRTQAIQTTLFRIIPSVNYNFKF